MMDPLLVADGNTGTESWDLKSVVFENRHVFRCLIKEMCLHVSVVKTMFLFYIT